MLRNIQSVLVTTALALLTPSALAQSDDVISERDRRIGISAASAVMAEYSAKRTFFDVCTAGDKSNNLFCTMRLHDAEQGITFLSKLVSKEAEDGKMMQAEKYIAIKQMAEKIYDDCILRRATTVDAEAWQGELTISHSICSLAKNDAYSGMDYFNKAYAENMQR